MLNYLQAVLFENKRPVSRPVSLQLESTRTVPHQLSSMRRSRDLWSRIEGEGMPDTTKHNQPFQRPRHRESPCSSKPDSSALARLLDEWMHGDETEQRETFEVLRRSLDEGRPEGYKLFS